MRRCEAKIPSFIRGIICMHNWCKRIVAHWLIACIVCEIVLLCKCIHRILRTWQERCYSKRNTRQKQKSSSPVIHLRFICTKKLCENSSPKSLLKHSNELSCIESEEITSANSVAVKRSKLSNHHLERTFSKKLWTANNLFLPEWPNENRHFWFAPHMLSFEIKFSIWVMVIFKQFQHFAFHFSKRKNGIERTNNEEKHITKHKIKVGCTAQIMEIVVRARATANNSNNNMKKRNTKNGRSV